MSDFTEEQFTYWLDRMWWSGSKPQYIEIGPWMAFECREYANSGSWQRIELMRKAIETAQDRLAAEYGPIYRYPKPRGWDELKLNGSGFSPTPEA